MININSLAQKIAAYKSCVESNNPYQDDHMESIETMINFLPSGSGFDAGCEIDMEASSIKKIVITFSYHHMDEHGGYDGWTDHKVIITPSFIGGYDIRITGKDRNMFKDYAFDVFHNVFTTENV